MGGEDDAEGGGGGCFGAGAFFGELIICGGRGMWVSIDWGGSESRRVAAKLVEWVRGGVGA